LRIEKPGIVADRTSDDFAGLLEFVLD